MYACQSRRACHGVLHICQNLQASRNRILMMSSSRRGMISDASECVRILFYVTAHIPHTYQFARRQAVLRSPLFHFTVNRGLRVLVQCIAINSRILFAIFKEGAENIVLCLTDMLRFNLHVVQCTSKYYTLKVTTENDWDSCRIK